MNLFSTPRRRIAWLVAAAVAVAVLDRALAPPDAAETSVVAAVTRERSSPSRAEDASRAEKRVSAPRGAVPAGPQADLERIARWQQVRTAASEEGAATRIEGGVDATRPDPFAPVAWAAPPASAARAVPPPPPPPPAPPPAPKFPYAYLGRMSDEGVRTVFFAKGERVLAVKVGDVVDSAFRIDEIDDKQMKLTYVPMNESAVVALGAAR